MLPSGVPKSLCMLVLGFVFSSLAWSLEKQGIVGLLWIIPCFILWGKCATGWQSYFLWLGYFLGVVNGLPFAAGKFFDLPLYQCYTLGVIFWVLHAAILATPFSLYSANEEKPILSHFKTLSFIFLITLAPPLGFALWGHPLSVSGVLFPGGSWAGLVLTLITVVVIVLPKRKTSFCLLALSGMIMLFCHLNMTDNEKNTDILSVSTNFASANFINPADKFQRHQNVHEKYLSMDSKRTVIFFPENILGRWNQTDTNLHHDLMKRSDMQSTVILGIHRPVSGNSNHYHNSLAIMQNEEVDYYDARLAMPIGNYNPLSDYSAVLSPFANPVRHISDTNIAFHICYEGALAWSIIHSMFHVPDMLLFANNVWWAEGTNLPVAINRHELAWARLFGLPYAIATNF